MGSRSLAGRLSIVTGAARGKSTIESDSLVHQINSKHPGIGSAIAENLASKGSSIILGYRSASSDQLARSLCQKLETGYAVKAIPARADVGTKAGCETIINLAKSHFADDMSGALRVDILVNNAGIAKLKGIGDITPEEFMEVYNTNVLGPIHMVQACLPHLPWDGSGRIVNVSSVGSSLGLPEQTLYAGSKGALEAMTRVWARAQRKSNRECNQSRPSGVGHLPRYPRVRTRGSGEVESYYPTSSEFHHAGTGGATLDQVWWSAGLSCRDCGCSSHVMQPGRCMDHWQSHQCQWWHAYVSIAL